MPLRKLEEIASCIYRTFVYPFVRIAIEIKTKSIMKQKSYTNKGTVLRGKNYVGKNTYISNSDIGFGTYVCNNVELTNARVGKYCSIAPGVMCIGGSHPTHDFVSTHPAFYAKKNTAGFTYVDGIDMSDSPAGPNALYAENKYTDEKKGYFHEIGNDVWIAAGAAIYQGVHIGDGAIVGAKSLVTKDIEPYAIYAGVPAKKIGQRFDDETIEKLLAMKWWDKGEEWIKNNIEGFADVKSFVKGHGLDTL